MTPELLERERPYLTGLAYRMLGSRADAEDAVQEALVRARAIDDARSPRALLTTIVTRLCLDELKSARRRREQYVGPWLPEPVIAEPRPGERMELAESLSFGFLLLLETLTPHERAVFVLREVLDLEFAEIAGAVGKSQAACRQLLHRAREHLASRRRRFPRRDAQEMLATRFLQALGSGDVAALVEVLVAEAEAVTDHGGKAFAARRIVRGANRVSRLLIGLARKGRGVLTTTLGWVNGNPALIVRGADGTLWGIVSLDTAIIDGVPRIAAVHFVRNPDKLRELSSLG